MNGAWLALLLSVALALWLLRRAILICEAANEADWGGRWLNRLDGLNRIFCRHFHGLPNHRLGLPRAGPVLVASNHVSGLDPLLLIAASHRPLRFIIAREEYERWWLKWLFRAIGCIPIDRERDPRTAMYAARRALAAGEAVAFFPQGGIHLDHEPPVPLRRGIVLLSQMTGAPIIPVRIGGVRGVGFTVAAVFMPSDVRLEARPPLHCKNQATESCLEQLSRALRSREHVRDKGDRRD
jgi:1-acyl-sn-glycerol-3-phosphate acyltransferase